LFEFPAGLFPALAEGRGNEAVKFIFVSLLFFLAGIEVF